LRVAVVRSEKLADEAGKTLGTLRMGNIHHWKLLSSNGW
jgi:hypothetical protein